MLSSDIMWYHSVKKKVFEEKFWTFFLHNDPISNLGNTDFNSGLEAYENPAAV